MTTTNTPEHHTAELGQAREHRGRLRTTRDVVAIIRDVLLIVLLAATLFVGGSIVKAVGDSSIGDGVGVDPSPSACWGVSC